VLIGGRRAANASVLRGFVRCEARPAAIATQRARTDDEKPHDNPPFGLTPATILEKAWSAPRSARNDEANIRFGFQKQTNICRVVKAVVWDGPWQAL
jgi:hypothetical protein